MNKRKQMIASVLVVCIAITSESITTLAVSQDVNSTQTQKEISTSNKELSSEKQKADSFEESKTATNTTSTDNASTDNTATDTTSVDKASADDTSTDNTSTDNTSINNTSIVTSQSEDKLLFNVSYVSDFIAVPESTEYAKDSKLVNPDIPTVEGLTFLGWYKDASYKALWNFDINTIAENITLYAKWQINQIADYSYELENDTIALTGYNGTSTYIEVPSVLQMNGKTYTITIKEDKLKENTTIVNVQNEIGVSNQTIDINNAVTPETNADTAVSSSIPATVTNEEVNCENPNSNQNVNPNSNQNETTTIPLTFTNDKDGTSTASSSISLDKTSIEIGKDKWLTLIATVSPSNSAIAWTTSDAGVATVDSNGKVTGVSSGTALITATLQDGSGLSASATVIVGASVTYYLDGGNNNPDNPIYCFHEAISLKNPTKAGYFFQGWYTDDKYKTSITTIAGNIKGDYTLYAKWKKIVVARTRINSLKNRRGKKIYLKVRKISGASGYEIVCSTDRRMKKDLKTITTTNTKNTITSLKKRKTYYVKVRAYIIDSTGDKIYGRYSTAKKVKISR